MGRREELLRRLMGLPSRSDNVRNMLAARRRMVDVPYKKGFDGIDLPEGGWIPTKRRIDASPVARGVPALATWRKDLLAEYVRETLDKNPSWAGFYAPAFNTVVYPDASNAAYGRSHRTIRRHEVMHGFNQAARDGVSGMPISSRLIAKLPENVAIPLDEMIATRAGGDRILDVPWAKYAETYRKQGDNRAARIADALHAAQVAGRRGGQLVRKAADNPMATGAGLVGGSALLYGLMSGDDGQ
jgi:hypothetical protein